MSSRLAIVLSTLCLAAWACSGGGGAAPGQEKGPCYSNGTCNAELSCFSHRCVRYDGGAEVGAGGGVAGAAAGSGGMSGAAGAAGTTSLAGAAGATGVGGASGAAGVAGTAGVSGKAGTSGAAGGAAGTKGTAGTSGGGGASGTTGAAGKDAGVDAPPAPRSCVGAPECFLPEELVPKTTPCDGVRLALAGPWLFWTNKAAQGVSKIGTLTHEIVGLVGSQNAPTLVIANDGDFSSAFYVTGGNELRETAQGSALGLPETANGAIGGLALAPAGEPTIFFSAGLGIYRNGQVGAVGFGTEETGLPAALAVDNNLGLAAIVTKDGNVDVIPLNSNDGLPVRCATDVASATNHACTRVAANQARLLLDDVYVFGGQVYWASGASIYRASAYAASGALSPLATTAHGGDVTSFSVIGTSIYLAEDGFIERARVGGAVTAIPIAAGQSHPSSVRVDGSNVYWTRSDCAIETVTHD